MSMQNACWLLPERGVEVAAREDRTEVESETVVGAHRERLEVLRREERVEVDGALGRRVLEEGIVEVPGPELVDRAPEPFGE